MHLLSPNASADDFLQLILRDPADVRAQFLESCGEELKKCVEAVACAHAAFHALEEVAPRTARTARVQLFLYAAHNCVITSLHLLVSGLAIPAGNLMRQYGEAVAMSLLCSTPVSLSYARYDKDRVRYPFHDSLHEVNKKKIRKAVGVDENAWNSFMKLTKEFDAYSHMSFMNLAHQLMLDQPGVLAMTGEFDPAKVSGYRIEFSRRETAAIVLAELVKHLQSRLPFEPNEQPRASVV